MIGAHSSADYEAPVQLLDPQSIKSGKPRIGSPGIAEIKQHTPSGIARRARQLDDRPVRCDPERRLLTYLPVPMKSKKPRYVGVFAQQVTPIKHGPFELTGKPIPAMIPFPSTDQPALFGFFIEKCVQDAFRPYLPPDATVAPHTGGLRWGPDVDWKESASFYAELAGETADPFFEELAAELSAMAATTLIEPEPVTMQHGLTLREGPLAPYPLHPRPTDVVQGEIGNCPIAAVMVAMAHARPASLGQILGQHHPGPVLSMREGDEIFRYWSDAYYDVVFPGRGSSTRITPFVYYDDSQVKYASTPNGPGWPSYIEKAYAVFKSRGGQGGSGGTYNRLNEKTSFTDPPRLPEVMQDLIGGFDIVHFNLKQFIDARRNARPMTAADIAAVAGRAGRRPTVAPSIPNGAERFGSPPIISSHGYAVLGYAAGKLRLQNPHGGPEQKISAASFQQAFQGIWQAV